MGLMATEYVSDSWTVAAFKDDERVTEWAELRLTDADSLISSPLVALPGATEFTAVRLRRPNGTETSMHRGGDDTYVSLEGSAIHITVPSRRITHAVFAA